MARRYRRRRTRRRSRRRGPPRYGQRVPRAPLFGRRRVIKLRYANSGQFNLAAPGPPDEWLCRSYRANSAGCPEVLPGGTLGPVPAGWNLIAPLFSKCFTLSSKISLVFLPNDRLHSAIPWVEKSQLSLDGLPSPALAQVLDGKFIRYGFYSSGNAGTGKITKSMRSYTKSWFSVKDVLDDQTLAQDIPVNPALTPPPEREVFYNAGWCNTHLTPAVTNQTPVDFCVTIDFLCVFTEPRDVT